MRGFAKEELSYEREHSIAPKDTGSVTLP
jgi:hypothetical protein